MANRLMAGLPLLRFGGGGLVPRHGPKDHNRSCGATDDHRPNFTMTLVCRALLSFSGTCIAFQAADNRNSSGSDTLYFFRNSFSTALPTASSAFGAGFSSLTSKKPPVFLSWLHHFRKLRIRTDYYSANHLGLVKLACSIICLNFLVASP